MSQQTREYQPEYQYKEVVITIDGDGRMTADGLKPVDHGDPARVNLGEVQEMTLGCEDGHLTVSMLRIPRCPAGKCYKKQYGVWGCWPC
jgi:hypothetical protein